MNPFPKNRSIDRLEENFVEGRPLLIPPTAPLPGCKLKFIKNTLYIRQ